MRESNYRGAGGGGEKGRGDGGRGEWKGRMDRRMENMLIKINRMYKKVKGVKKEKIYINAVVQFHLCDKYLKVRITELNINVKKKCSTASTLDR